MKKAAIELETIVKIVIVLFVLIMVVIFVTSGIGGLGGGISDISINITEQGGVVEDKIKHFRI